MIFRTSNWVTILVKSSSCRFWRTRAYGTIIIEQLLKRWGVTMNKPSPEKPEQHDLVLRIADEIGSKQVIDNMVNLLRACADETRLKILIALSRADLSTQELSEILSLSPSAISHQLRLLKLSNLVDSTRVGKRVLYKLKDKHVLELISSALEHAKE